MLGGRRFGEVKQWSLCRTMTPGCRITVVGVASWATHSTAVQVIGVWRTS